jgi:serine/threonine-protein kinase
MSASRILRPGDVIAHKYEVLRLLGQGGMGAVFEARHTIIEKSVALKWLHTDGAPDPDAMHRLIREARAAGRIHHPNVVAIHDVGEHQGSLFLVMEYLRGKSLDALLADGSLSPTEALTLLLPAMRGVHAAHERGVLHRDLKPANLFICKDDGQHPVAKVLDFGVSKIMDARFDEAASTQTGAQLGTPAYMSPEQLRGDKTIDRRVDVYSFGVILYRIFAGRLPFTAASASGLAIKAATTDAPPLFAVNPELPRALSQIVARAMARNRDDRFEDMQTLVAALEPFTTNLEVAAPRVSGPHPDANTLHATAAGVSSGRATRVRFGAWATGALLAAGAIAYFAATKRDPAGALHVDPGHSATTTSPAALASPPAPDATHAPEATHSPTAPGPVITPVTADNARASLDAKHVQHAPGHPPNGARPRPASSGVGPPSVPAAPPAGKGAAGSGSAHPGVHLSVDDF